MTQRRARQPSTPRTATAYREARDRYAELGVNTETALATLAAIPISVHCWQGDDVAGFEGAGQVQDGGLVATGNHPGRARNADELRADLDRALSLAGGRHRLNLHALYAETGARRVDRDALEPAHFARWLDWARARGLGLDFNPSFFSHRLAADGLTLSHPDPAIQAFWIAHAQACRRIGAHFGVTQGSPCVTNIWIPDGAKDTPADRLAPRQRLESALDTIFSVEYDTGRQLDALESKLFGIGSESYVVGSHEFYLAYAVRHDKALCLDMGHFHPTESVADKLSALLLFLDDLLLHVSRGIRWDSDHVVILDDPLRALAQEITRADALARVHIGLDYFDATINRVAAWVVGLRAMRLALLQALLEPTPALRAAELAGDLTGRLAWSEALKSLPWSAVWDEFCRRQAVPTAGAWLADVRRYEKRVLARRAP